MRSADLTGSFGSAWDVSHVPRMGPSEQACKRAFIVNIPSAHPWWPTYMLALISLEDLPGVPPAFKEYDDAEWELALYALDPDQHPNPEDYWSWAPLTPANVVVQFDCDADRADETVRLVAQALVDGGLPAEPDDYHGARDRWRSVVRDTATCRRH